MSEEWGPWIPYRGEGYLSGVSLGMIIQVKGAIDGKVLVSQPRVVDREIMYLNIVEGPNEKLLAHRIRKPRGLTILEKIAEGVRDPEAVE